MAAGEKVALSTDEPRYPLVRTSVCPTGLPDLGNGVQMERSAAHDAATPPRKESCMLPSSFECHPAGCIDEARSLLSQPGDDAKVLAGGRSLIPAA